MIWDLRLRDSGLDSTGPTILATIQLHLRKCDPNIYVRRLYLVVLKLEILQNLLNRFPRVVRNTQHVVNVENDILIILKDVWLHCWP